eukprot:Opistho-2@66282
MAASAAGVRGTENRSSSSIAGASDSFPGNTSFIARERTPLLDDEEENFDGIDDAEFRAAYKEILAAIDEGVHPKRIEQGSSGSYFVLNREKEIIGVFKPKDEEPYGQFNPKWTKWFHKVCCPCCFGRSCLIPNQGYMSEAGASLVDSKMKLHVVPKTKVVRLASPVFNYSFLKREYNKARNHQLPPKVGSLQLFVRGYRDAIDHLYRFEKEPLSASAEKQFQLQFERLVVLDYLIRNTDRGNDNWLIKVDEPTLTTASRRVQSPNSMSNLPQQTIGQRNSGQSPSVPAVEGGEVSLPDTASSNTSANDLHVLGEEWNVVTEPTIKIAAIDNGLAFPIKHPDSWRTYPYHWAWLPQAKKPFSPETIDAVLPLLQDPTFMEDIEEELTRLFLQDSGTDKGNVERQMSVFRGQVQNLVKGLQDAITPNQLVQLPVFVVEKKKDRQWVRWVQKFRTRAPFFSWC